MTRASKGNASYRLIVDEIAGKIHRGDLKPDEKLPTMREMRANYMVSHGTMLMALAILRDRGLTYGRQGAGIYVRGQGDHR